MKRYVHQPSHALDHFVTYTMGTATALGELYRIRAMDEAVNPGFWSGCLGFCFPYLYIHI